MGGLFRYLVSFAVSKKVNLIDYRREESDDIFRHL